MDDPILFGSDVNPYDRDEDFGKRRCDSCGDMINEENASSVYELCHRCKANTPPRND